jgi:hypothetical protein
MAESHGTITIESGLKFGHCEDCIFWRDRMNAGYQAAIAVIARNGNLDTVVGSCHARAPVFHRDGYTTQPVTSCRYGCGEFQDFRQYHPRTWSTDHGDTRLPTEQPTPPEAGQEEGQD